jgi:hypothetical protein
MTAMVEKVLYLGKTLDLKSRTIGMGDQTFWMAVACTHRWASGAMGRKEGGGGRLG